MGKNGIVDIKGYLLRDDIARMDLNMAKFCSGYGYSRGVVNHSLYRDRMDLELLRCLADKLGTDHTKYLLGENEAEEVFRNMSVADKLKAMPSEALTKLQMQIAIEIYNREFAYSEMKRRRYKNEK